MDDNRPIYNERCEIETDPVEQVRLLRNTINSWRFQYNGRVYTDQELGAELAALDGMRQTIGVVIAGLEHSHLSNTPEIRAVVQDLTRIAGEVSGRGR